MSRATYLRITDILIEAAGFKLTEAQVIELSLLLRNSGRV